MKATHAVPRPAGNEGRGPRQSRVLAGILAGLFLAFVAAGVRIYLAERAAARAEAEAELRTIADLKVAAIARWRDETRANAVVMAHSPLFVAALRRFTDRPHLDGGDAEDLLAAMDLLRREHASTTVALLDLAGHVLLSVGEGPLVLHETTAAALTTMVRERRAVLTDLHLGNGPHSAHVDAIVPVALDSDAQEPPRGAVLVRTSAETFLYPLLDSWPVPTRTAETLLVRRDGDSVLFLNELRHQEQTALRLRIPLSQDSLPAVMAIKGVTGVARGADYRGVEVLAILEAVPNSPWFMVAKIDVDEALATWRSLAVFIVALLFAAFIAAAAATTLVWQTNAKATLRTLLTLETQRREGEERYRVTLKSIGDAVLATDGEGRVEVLNSVAETLTGFTTNEAIGRQIEEVFHIEEEQTCAPVANPVRRVLSDGKVIGLANHTVLVARDGSRRPIADSGAPIRDDDGRLVGVVLVFRDQTAERATERALQESKETYADLYENAPDMLCSVEPTTARIVRCNGTLARTLGYTRDELLGRPLLDLYDLDSLVQAGVAFDTLRTAGEVPPTELRLRKKDGTPIDVSLAMSAVKDTHGRVVDSRSSWRDISDRRRAERQRDALQEQLRHAQKMEAVGRLAGGVAHDFNNMLVVILSYLGLVLEGEGVGEQDRRDLIEVQRAAERAAMLTRQLLAFSRKQILAPMRVDLGEVVRRVEGMLRRLIGEDILLAVHTAPDLWATKVDPGQIEQVIMNLAVNSRDAMPDGGMLTIELGNVELDEDYAAHHVGVAPGAYVMLSVSDTGRGMDDATKARLFEPFFTTKEQGKGTGLGLATVHGIIQQSGGHVFVYSEQGHGTAFKVYLPRDVMVCGVGAAASAAPREARGTETILLVEDEAAVRNLSRRILDAAGYTVLAAASGAEALGLCATHAEHLDLLVTDVVMPQMNGRLLAERITALRPDIRVLYMSGYTDDAIVQHGVLEAGTWFLSKPFRGGDLTRKVREVLDAKAPAAKA